MPDITRESFNDLVTRIGQCEDSTERTTLLSELSEGVTPMFESIQNLTNQNTDLNNRVQEVTDRNMELFLRVGAKNSDNADDNNSGNPPEKRKYEDLFDENGRLKR